ncbi:MAG TPA: anti-sigma factor [Natronosporangium sp.]
MSWHLPAATLRGYLAGAVTDPVGWSVEAHLTECERCRRLLAELSTADEQARRRLDDGWAALAAALPPPGAATPDRAPAGTRWREAWLLLAGGPVARWAWLLACALVLVFAAVLTAVETSRVPWFGLVAPLVPVLGVAVSYGSRLDAPREIIAATPGGGLRLLLIRTLSVLLATTPIALVAGHLSGYGAPTPWLLASLALTLATLALGSVIGIGWAAAGLAVGWVAVVSSAFLYPVWRQPLVLTAEAEPWLVAVAAVAAVVIALRREAFNHLTVHSRIEVLK